MRAFLLILALLALSGVTLTTATNADGIAFTVQTDAPRHFYVQIDPTDGVSAEPQIFEFDLAAGETFGGTVHVAPIPGLHPHGESVRVRVWASDGGTDPAADQTIPIPVTPLPARVYLPVI